MHELSVTGPFKERLVKPVRVRIINPGVLATSRAGTFGLKSIHNIARITEKITVGNLIFTVRANPFYEEQSS